MKPGKFFDELTVGMSTEVVRTVTEADVQSFAQVSGDYNPIHMDEDYANASVFGGRVAHGALTASYISAVLGNDLPGPGSIFTDLNMRFKRPVRIGDTVTARAEVTEMVARGNLVTLSVRCIVNGKVVVQGDARVVVPSRKVD